MGQYLLTNRSVVGGGADISIRKYLGSTDVTIQESGDYTVIFGLYNKNGQFDHQFLLNGASLVSQGYTVEPLQQLRFDVGMSYVNMRLNQGDVLRSAGNTIQEDGILLIQPQLTINIEN